jgi:hypothetical protein
MRLKAARHETGLTNMDTVAHLKTIDPRITKPIFSFMENGIVLPTPRVFKGMCRLYNKRPEEMLTPADVDFGITKPQKKDGHRLRRKFTARLTPWAESILTPEILQVCGYQNKQDFFYACLRRLEAQHAAIQKYKTRRFG